MTRCRDQRGIGLCEVLITALLVTISIAGLLQFTGQILFWYERNQLESRNTIELWNRTRALRRSRAESADTLAPVQGARPLRRFILGKTSGGHWEVLCAEK